MRDEYQTFLERPTAQNFRSVRRAVLDNRRHDAHPLDSPNWDQLIQGRRFRQVRQLADDFLGDWPLCPRAHYFAALAAQELGDGEDAQLETFLFQTCLQALLATGDGSRWRPYLVTRISDEYDVLRAKKLESCSQTMVETGTARLDVITCTDGTRLWFDVTDLVGNVGSDLTQASLPKTV